MRNLVVVGIVVVAEAASADKAKPKDPTVAQLSALADKPDKVVDLVDAKVGIVFIDHFAPPGEDATPWQPRELHLCDGKQLAKLFASDVAPALTAARSASAIACNGSQCRAGGTGEWDPVYHFAFKGDRLAAITIDDEVLVADDAVNAELDAQAKLIAKLSGKCP